MLDKFKTRLLENYKNSQLSASDKPVLAGLYKDGKIVSSDNFSVPPYPSPPPTTSIYGFIPYYVCTRDPDSINGEDPSLIYMGYPALIQAWLNLTTFQLFWSMDNTLNPLQWEKMLTDANAKTVLNLIIDTARTSNAVSLALNTASTPDFAHDQEISVSIRQVNTLLSSTQVLVQRDDGAGFFVLATLAEATGVVSDKTSSYSFLVPAGSIYKFVTSGAGTITIVEHYSTEI